MMVNTNMMLMVVLLWCGTLPVASPKHHPYMAKTFLKNLDCDNYILPIHAIWVPRTSCEDNKHWKCQAGFISQVQSTCKHGDWFLEPTCQAVECLGDESITNSADLTESRIFETELSFDCLPGYTRNGETGILKCGQNGTWTEQLPCQAVECLGDQSIANSNNLTESRIFERELSFDCLPGYTRNGETGILKCGQNGTWTEQLPCQVVECPPGENITNSDNLTEVGIFEEELSFNCVDGYSENNGTGILKCDENGVWEVKQRCQGIYRLREHVEIPEPINTVPATDCPEACSNDTRCGFYQIISRSCTLYPKPLIDIIFDTRNHMLDNLVGSCSYSCDYDSRCLLYSYNQSSINLKTTCLLFDVGFLTVQNTFTIINGEGTISEIPIRFK